MFASSLLRFRLHPIDLILPPSLLPPPAPVTSPFSGSCGAPADLTVTLSDVTSDTILTNLSFETSSNSSVASGPGAYAPFAELSFNATGNTTLLRLSSSSALPAALDEVCVRVTLEINLSPVTLTAPQTLFSSGDDIVSPPVDIGFAFPFAGEAKTSVRVSTNGFVNFDLADNNPGCCSGQPVPNLNSPNSYVAVAWTDLFVNTNGRIAVQQFADRFVVEYADVGMCCGQLEHFRFQMHLLPNGCVQLHYSELANVAVNELRRYTVGAEGPGGLGGFAVLNSGSAADFVALEGRAFQFCVGSPFPVTPQATIDLPRAE